MKHVAFLALGCSLVMAACGEPPVESTDSALEPGCTALGEPIIAHACAHVTDGSAMSVNASSTLAFSGSTPNVTPVHTYWTVNIPGSGATRTGAVKYVPATTGDWAILQNGSVPLTVIRHSTSATVSPVLSQSISTCTGLTRLSVYPLTAGVTYRIVFGATSSATTQIELERASEFTAYYYPDADLDTYGDVEGEVATACLPPSGYVTDSADCDDADANVHPGVTDPPGDADLDCNGIP